MGKVNQQQRENAQRGAAWLDQLQPGWAARINPERLKMQSCLDCILGQIFGNYNEGLILAGFPLSPITLRHPKGADDWAFHHGFLGDDWNRGHLTDAWKHEITLRLKPQPTESHS